jgi:SAM-dependent methyltransferase
MDWYPTPSYLVKKKVILDYLKRIPVQDFLEVGCGAGDLLDALNSRGYHGMGIDISPEAVAAARKRLQSGMITIEQKKVEEIDTVFDLVIASEVLEHCPDDIGFLRGLRTRIRTGGHLFLTVPAHMDKWGANDDFSGHLRRYEREELREMLVRAKLEPLAIYSYGVPVYNMMKPLYDRAIRKRLNHAGSMAERTGKSSGMWLLTDIKGVFPLMFNDFTMYPFYLFQKLFFNTDLGNGYFAAAKKART